MHDAKGLFYPRHREEFILFAVDEKHGLGTGYAGYMRIVHPAAETREAVGKAAILRSVVLKRHLFVSSHHPTD